MTSLTRCSRGASTWKVTVPLPTERASTAKCTGTWPFAGIATACSLGAAESAPVVRLDTFTSTAAFEDESMIAVASKLSPTRRKRGSDGRSMSGSLVRNAASALPKRSSTVAATAKTFHVVTLSGSLVFTVATPSGPVITLGRNHAVGRNAARPTRSMLPILVAPERMDGALVRCPSRRSMSRCSRVSVSNTSERRSSSNGACTSGGPKGISSITAWSTAHNVTCAGAGCPAPSRTVTLVTTSAPGLYSGAVAIVIESLRSGARTWRSRS